MHYVEDVKPHVFNTGNWIRDTYGFLEAECIGSTSTTVGAPVAGLTTDGSCEKARLIRGVLGDRDTLLDSGVNFIGWAAATTEWCALL